MRADAYNPSTTAIGAGSDRYRQTPAAHSLRADDLEELRRLGVPVFVFTVNDARAEGLAVHLAEAGVAGVFTDDPRALRSLWPR